MDVLLGIFGKVMEQIASVTLSVLLTEAQASRARFRLRRPERGELAGRATKSLTEMRTRELRALPEHEWQAATMAVRDSLAAAGPMSVEKVLAAHLSAEELARQVTAQSRGIRERAGLSEPGLVAYQRILSQVCAEILRYARSLPEYPAAVDAYVVDQIGTLREEVSRLRPKDPENDFDALFRAQVLRGLDSVELFGVAQGRPAARYSLGAAFVAMTLARAGEGEHDGADYTGSGIPVTDVLAERRRVLLRGGAGAGKTTLLRWLAVTAAQRPDAEVPFFLPLRRYLTEPLPEPAQMILPVARMVADEAPAGWVAKQLRSGQAVVLVDGIDEVPAERRDEVRRWLADLTAGFPEVRYVVTTRPFAVDIAWLRDDGFATDDLLPMSLRGIDDFLGRWHEAARRTHAGDDEMREWLDESRRRLAKLLETTTELRRLAGSPLLCGLICALFQKRNMRLPRDRKGIYEAALDLLLEGWDERKDPHLGAGLSLDKAEQLVLLQRLAYSFVRNQDLQISREDATRRITGYMRGLRQHDADPAQVLQRTLERSGLLREPEDNVIQFLHRTFRDYLAAKEIADVGDFRHLVEHAHLGEWQDVVVMAVAHASRAERDRILRDLMHGNAASAADKRIRDRLDLIAAACLEQAVVVDTDEVRRQVEQAARRLIPPATLDDAELLARAGAFVLDLLPGPEELDQDQAVAVIRTAALIGGPRARETIERFTTVPAAKVIDELLRAWRDSDDPAEYARTVLADVDFGDAVLERHGWRQVQHLSHLTKLTAVRSRGDVHPLTPLAGIPSLRRLELMQNDVVRDLSPLAECRSLRELGLILCLRLRDLSPLTRSGVEELSLFQTDADLSTLHAPSLHRLSIRHPALREGLHALPGDLPLRELAVTNRAGDRRLLGVERFQDLERVSVVGTPDDEDVAALAQLPKLTGLTVTQPESLAALAALAALPALRTLHLIDPAPASDEELAALRSRLPGVGLILKS